VIADEFDHVIVGAGVAGSVVAGSVLASRLIEAPPSLFACWKRGRTLGDSSSINGMIHHRGQPANLDNWAQRGPA
jgi:choline dehydrogenase-like flavoprotein